MRKLSLIIKREFIAKIRNKSFVIMTFLSPIILIGMGFLIYFLTQKNDQNVKKVLFVDESNIFSEEDFKNMPSIQFTDFSGFGIEFAKEKVLQNEYFGVLYIPNNNELQEIAKAITFFTNETSSFELTNILESNVEKKLQENVLKSFGFDSQRISISKIEADLKTVNFSGEETYRLLAGLKIAIGAFAGYLLMMFVIIYGTAVMRSVMEEKTSRIVEVIVSSVKPFQLMLGKIIGNAMAGVLQFIIWGFLLFFILTTLSAFFGVDMFEVQFSRFPKSQLEMAKNIANPSEMQLLFKEIVRLPIFKLGVLFIFYFFGGFMLYSSFFASIGAAVDRETDTQQFVLPVILPLIIGVYIGFATVIYHPNGLVSTIFSHIPFTSPIVMLMRVPFGVSWGEILISMLILTGSFILMVCLAAKIYRVGILTYGKKTTFKDLYKWLKYKG